MIAAVEVNAVTVELFICVFTERNRQVALIGPMKMPR